MTMITRSISRGQLVAFTFVQDNVAASQTDVQLNIAEVAAAATLAVAGYEVPWAGEVVGLSYTLSAAGTAGVFTIGPTINGTEDADGTVTVGTNAANYTVIPRGKIVFSASDSIGAEITTDGSWDGTTSDLAVTLFVLLYVDGI